jgi:hypothetical protein
MDPNITQSTQPVTQPIVPPVPEQPAQPKLKLSKWIIAVVVVLILLIGGGVSAYVLHRNFTSKILPSPTPTNTITPTSTPIPTVATQTPVSSGSAWLSTVVMTTPVGWIKIICNDSVAFNPKGGIDGCGTEPNAFAIIVYKSNSYDYDTYKNDSAAVISNLRENLNISGKKATQFDLKYTQGQPAGDYKETILFLEDGSYINIVLNHLVNVDIYNQFINDFKFVK